MKLFRGGIVFAALAIVSTFASAQTTTTYTGGKTGVFEDGSNYDMGAPGPASGTTTVVFSPPSGTTYTITQTETPDVIKGLTIDGGGTVQFNSNGNDLEVIGSTPTATSKGDVLVDGGSTFNYAGGTFTLDDGFFLVGDASGSGTVNLQSGTLDYDVQTTQNATQITVGYGGTGTFNQSTGTTVTTGQELNVGYNGGTGTYNLNGTSILQTGSALVGAPYQYIIAVGGDISSTITGTQGFLNINDSSTVDINNSSVLAVGTVFSLIGSGTTVASVHSSGTVNQDGAGSHVNIEAGGLLDVGDYTGATGTYNLSAGTLEVFDNGFAVIGFDDGAAGAFYQTGGTFISDPTAGVFIGYQGDGIYNLKGGTATFGGGFQVGGQATGSGILNQVAGILTSTDTAFIGGATGTSTGTYNLSGGTATFNGGLDVGATGTVNQSGGTMIIPTGQTLNLSTVGATYNLDGGVLDAAAGTLMGTTGEGTLNFGGGTLQPPTGGTLTDALDGTLTGQSTLDGTNAGITLTGHLTGTGGFTIVGGNPVTISAGTTTAYTGATIISGGDLDLNSPDATDRFVSPISGASGTLNLTSAGVSTLQLTGTADFLGTTMIAAGNTLQIYNGTLGDVGEAGASGTLIVGQDGTDATAPTSGTLNLVGSNTFTGPTTVNSGFELLANGLDSTTVTNTGFLGSNTNPYTTFDVGTGGSGTLNQPMEGTKAAEGTLLVRITNTEYDNYRANSATLYGQVAFGGYAALGETSYPIVNANTLHTGTLGDTGPGGLSVAETNSAALSATLSTVPDVNSFPTPPLADTLYLNVTQLPFSDFALTPNQKAVANALDVALADPSPNDALFTSLDTLDAGALANALDQLTPRPYLFMRDIAFENSTFLAQNVDSRMATIRDGATGIDTSGLSIMAPGMESNLGRSLGSMLAYNGEGAAPNGVNYYPQDTYPADSYPTSAPLSPTTPQTISDSPDPGMTPAPMPAPTSSIFNAPNFSEFISGDLILADLNQNSQNNIPETHYTAGDATAGIAFKMSSNLSAGVLFDYNHTDARTDSQGSHVRVDSYSPGLFATFSEKGFYVNGLFTFGYDNYSNDRVLSFGGTNATASSTPSGQQYTGDLDFGYDFHPDHDKQLTIGPTLELEYTHVDVDSFSENGAGPANLTVGSQSGDSLRGRIGGHIGYLFHSGSIIFQPNLFAAYQHEFLDSPFDLSSQLSEAGTTPFTTQGAGMGKDSALIGVGATAVFYHSMAVYLNYLAEIGEDDDFGQSIQGGFKASF